MRPYLPSSSTYREPKTLYNIVEIYTTLISGVAGYVGGMNLTRKLIVLEAAAKV